MPNNVGMIDRAIRAILGIGLIWYALYHYLTPAWVWIVAILGLILIITGLSGYCPIYQLLKISTKK
ncbi:MAG TPA: DUF2892 domain-containing protein [Candidatus Omnitrophota bacterium]|nr:DUF2892 domain-containing protein [Candidatus Omnitrophota bacterium]